MKKLFLSLLLGMFLLFPTEINANWKKLNFGGSTPNALDEQSAAGTESADFSCEDASLIVVKTEYSAADVTAPLWIILKDHNNDTGRIYSAKFTPTNTGENEDIQESGFFHGETKYFPTYRAKNYRIVLAEAPSNSGTVSVWSTAVSHPGSTELPINQTTLTELQTVRVLDSGNSTTTVLEADEVYSGEWKNVLGYASVSVEISSDQASATNGFAVQTSDDGSTVRHSHIHTLVANVNHHFVYTLTGNYYRVKYTNGGTLQTSFFLNSILSKADLSHQHTHGVEFVVDADHPADLVRSVITAKRADDAYANIRSTNGDNLKISLEELETGISSNANSQLNVTQFDSSGNELFDQVAKPGHVILSNGTINNIIDPTGALVTIELPHQKIHNEDRFYHKDFVDLATTASRTFAVTIPNTSLRGHFTFEIDNENESTVFILEDSTINTNGTLITLLNRDRNSANTTTIGLFHTPLGFSGGTTIFNSRKGSGNQIGSSFREINELIMKQGVKYLISIQNNGGGNGLADWLFDFYEVP